EDYRVPRDSLIYQCYGDDQPTGEELSWIQQVKYMYDYDITKEQLAWWRYKLAEDIKDEQLMMQYYPPTEEHAFILSGYRFFDLKRLKQTARQVKAQKPPSYHRYRFGPTYDMTEVYPSAEHNAQLKIFAEADPRGFYVIGADPSHGSNPDSDHFAIE